MDRPTRLIAAPVAAVLLLAIPALWAYYALRVAGQPVATFRPEGYNRIVDRWLDGGRIAEEGGKLELREELLTETEKQWAADSFLRSDLERFNGDPARGIPRDLGVFLQHDGRWRINPFEHAYAPFSFRQHSWRGRLSFRSPARGASLWSTGLRVVLEEPAPERLPVEPRQYRQLALDAPVSPENPRVVVGPGIAVTYRDSSRNLAELTFLGNDVVLTVRDDRRLRTWLDGRRIETGNRVVLRDGDVLEFEKPAGAGRALVRSFLFRKDRVTSGIISSVQRVNGRWQRLHRRSLDFGPELAGAIEALARQGSAAIEELDVELTLDEALQVPLTEALAAEAARAEPRRAAALAVMDLRQGELLALASYPSAERAAELARSDAERRILQRNHNLHLHPVGSAGKVFLTTAALAARPELARLELRCHATDPDYRWVLDVELPEPDGNERVAYLANGFAGCGEWFGVEDFLAHSANKFMVDLFTMALAEEGSAAAGGGGPLRSWKLGPRVLGPGFDHGRYLTAERTNVTGLERQRPFRMLEEIFGDPGREGGVESELVRPAGREDTRYLFALELYEPLTEHFLVGEQGPTALLSDEVTPERTNLRVNTLQHLRQEYVSFLLGGSTHEWTNVQLCESLARLVTGRRIRARLVHRLLQPEGAVAYEGRAAASEEAAAGDGRELDLDAGIRQQVLRGMRAAIQRGTAAPAFGPRFEAALAYGEPLPEGVAVRLYGKTGTQKAGSRPSSMFLLAVAAERDGVPLAGITAALYLDSTMGGPAAAHVARRLFDSTLWPYVDRMLPQWLDEAGREAGRRAEEREPRE